MWDENLILPNYENEANTYGPDVVAEYLYGAANWDGETGWSTLAWLQNDSPWYAFPKQDAILLQIFPKDVGWAYDKDVIAEKMGHCLIHARELERTYVGVTYQTYDGISPDVFDVASYMHSTFPGNVIGHGEWSNWYK